VCQLISPAALCFYKPMAHLDSDDLKMIKNLLETTIDEVFERKQLATKDDVANLLASNDLRKFVSQVKSILNSPLR
jgi:hypothetical protein